MDCSSSSAFNTTVLFSIPRSLPFESSFAESDASELDSFDIDSIESNSSDHDFILPNSPHDDLIEEPTKLTVDLKDFHEIIEKQWERGLPYLITIYSDAPSNYKVSTKSDLCTLGIDEEITKVFYYIISISKKNSCFKSFYCGHSFESGHDEKKFKEYVFNATVYHLQRAIYKMGKSCLNGLGIVQDLNMAKKFLKLSVAHRNTKKEYVPYQMDAYRDLKKSYELSAPHKLLKCELYAANHEIAEAANNVGHICAQDASMINHREKSFFWYKKAAFKGLAQAQLNLSECYRTGFGIKKNEPLSGIWRVFATESASWSGTLFGKWITDEGIDHNNHRWEAWTTEKVGEAYYNAALFLLVEKKMRQHKMTLEALMKKAIFYGHNIDNVTQTKIINKTFFQPPLTLLSDEESENLDINQLD